MRAMRLHALAPLALVLLLAGCGGSSSEPDGGTPASGCRAPSGVNAAPQSIDETVTLINALPKPLTLSCFLESLDRPLRISASESTFSAQPANGTRSPRVFLFSGPLVVSVVPEGPGLPLLELSELGPNARSVKAEIHFPVEGPLAPEAPFARVVQNGSGTSCGTCHGQEQPERTLNGTTVYSSRALQPAPQELVPVESVRGEAQKCDEAAEPERCVLLKAIFSHGAVEHQPFPADLPTIYD